jgi:hypothetical protein
MDSQIPTTSVHSSKIFKIQQNETVKMTYVFNMIRIPTHGVDLWHHGLRIGERKPKSSMEPPQGEDMRRKKERKEEESERGAVGLLVGQSCQVNWRAMSDGVTRAARLSQRGKGVTLWTC